ncbi:MAG TPA: hypothetical protein VNN09_06600 [Candidatus Competibacteraceae bacterium]|nr:hypothetical protein [Candidatus Competibacteraceae bacterium]
MLWRYRLPFLLMPVAVTLWYMSMDVAVFLAQADYADWELRRDVSLWFGLGMTLLAFYCDLRAGRRFGFWLYLFGVTAFWCGLSLRESDSELAKFLYCLLNLGLIFFGAALRRRVFAVYGGLGVFGYLSYLAWRVFEDSLWFPVVLSFMGFAIIWLGFLWQQHMEALGSRLRGVLPGPLRAVIEEGD